MPRWRLSLKQRLLLLITLLTALLCLTGGVYIVIRAQNDIRGEVRSATDLIEHYLKAQLAVAEMVWRQSNDILPQLQLDQLRDVRHVEVYFYNRNGALQESSVGMQPRKHRAPFWFVWLVQRSFAPIADSKQPVAFEGVQVGEVVIHPDPTFEMDEIWNVTRGLLGLLLVFFLLVNALVWWAVVRAMRPVERVRDALREFGAGDLHARLPPLDLPELAGLSSEFNRMADTLEQSTAQNERLTRRLIQTQEDERTRIAHELHDEIGQCVTAIHADAVVIQHSSRGSIETLHESASGIIDATAQIKTMLRGMLQRLRPAVLDDFGLDAALRELVATFRQRNEDTLCALHIEDAAMTCTGDLATVIYRLVQESLTNAARHAHARRVTIDISILAKLQSEAANKNASLIVRIDDDGVGFDAQANVAGFGQLGMRERVRAFDGSLTIRSTPGSGTRVIATLPWTQMDHGSVAKREAQA